MIEIVISNSSLPSPGRAKTVQPRVAGRRFGVGLLARCERLESASCDLSGNIKFVVRRRFSTPDRSRRERLGIFPCPSVRSEDPNSMAEAYGIIEHRYNAEGTTWR
jgi:hypothetical protein